MKQIAFALAFTLVAPAAWAADKLPLSQISNYLNNMKTVQTTFTQVNDDGSLSTGKLWLQRPGKMRFEYNPPDRTLVVADGVHVGIADAKSNQKAEAYPLRRTPLSIILARDVDLGRARMVVGHTGDDKSTTVVAQDPDHPEYGSIELVFTGSPVELRQWVINDNAGAKTTVVLGELTKGGNFKDEIFALPKGAVIRKE